MARDRHLASGDLCREAAPLEQRGRASLFVNLAGHEMTLLTEMIVDLRMPTAALSVRSGAATGAQTPSARTMMVAKVPAPR
jgi:hypothetical protein